MSYGCDIPYLDYWKVSELVVVVTYLIFITGRCLTSCGYDIPCLYY